MLSPALARIKWWTGFVLSITLPFWLYAITINLGGCVIEEIDYSNFKLLISLSFIAAFILLIHFLRQPDPYLALRFATGSLLGIFFLFGAFLMSLNSSCNPEKITLGKISFDERKYAATKGGCDDVAYRRFPMVIAKY